MNFSNLNLRNFIDYIVNFDDVNSIINKCNTQSEKGFIFERLYDIIIKFGFCEIFNKDYCHLLGNSNNGKLKKLIDINEYLEEKVLSGNSGGCSDITLLNNETNEYIFVSSKYPKSEEDNKKGKSVSYYDIQNIIAMINDNSSIYKKYKIFLIVPDKNIVFEKANKANKSSNYITKHIKLENILDEKDLNKYFLKFKYDIIKNKNEDWNNLYLENKEKLNLRFHQELITLKTSELINENNKYFLWGCKCRSGKTYMIGGLCEKELERKKKLNVLILTPAPTETIPQFTEDLFLRYKNFDKFKINNIESSSKLKKINLEKNNIIIVSKQLLQKYIKENTINEIKDLNLDLIVFDENHFGGTTTLAKEIIDSYSSENTAKIFLTATYFKPLHEWYIKEDCQLYWDIEDEQICKDILNDNKNIKKLEDKYGKDMIKKTLNIFTKYDLSLNEIFNSYKFMPELHILSNMFDEDRYLDIKNKLAKNKSKMGFCFETLFGLNSKKNKFSYENEIKTFLRYISGSNKEEDCDKTIFTRINYICSEKNTRLPFTQIWFLPSDNINEISLKLKDLMNEDIILKRYEILCIYSKNKSLPKDVKDEISKREIEAKENGKLGLILLAGNMLGLGITLSNCDLVMLLNNTSSTDKVFQQMYRSMSESKNKKIGFVVDLNINRVLSTCINYSIYQDNKGIDDKIEYLIKNHLINIDIDMFDNKKINSDIIINKLMKVWKENPVNNFSYLLKKLNNEYKEFDNSIQKLLNETFSKSLKDNKINIKLNFKDEDHENQEFQNGREKIILNDSDENLNLTDNEDNINHTEVISFTKDVLPYIIPLICILTIKNSNTDFIKMLNDIKENPELLETFDDQCLIWWNKKDLIDIIKNIILKYFDKKSNTYNISIQFKMSMKSLIDKPKELLELISECLKCKDLEVKKNGEVFT